MANGKWTRRKVIQTGLVAAAGLTGCSGAGLLRPAPQARRILGANDRIRIGVAGINGRGGAHIKGFGAVPNVEIAYLIDPDSRLFASRIKAVEEKAHKAPKTVQDIRRALDDKSLDAISIATPNHWHSLMTILACQAGKDVYVEKPMSHNLHEGRVAVETARKYNRIVQHGTQRRSEAGWANVIAAVQSGRFGRLLVARGLCYKNRESIGSKSPAPVPPELDFNLWLGPVAQQSYHENLVHYNWHWFWDFGNGDIGNQGVHQMDVARWGIRGGTLPKSVISLGGRFGYEDQGQTPNTQIAIMDFGPTQLVFEVRGLKTEPFLGARVGNIFHTEAGTIVEQKFYPKGSDKAEPLPVVDNGRGPGKGPWENFIAAVRSGKVFDLNADVLEAHYSSALGHLANASYRLGEQVPFNPRTKAFGENKDAYETLERMQEHLTSRGMKLDGMSYRLGRKLIVDAKTERIVGDPEANRMMFANYRKPFVVPDTV